MKKMSTTPVRLALLCLTALFASPAGALTQVEVQKLLASDGAANDFLGYSVAISGDTAVIGALGDDGNRGSAYVFIRSGTTWTQQAKLIASDGEGDDRLGFRVAIAGDTAVIGAIFADEYRGSAYVFTRSGTTWTQQAKLTSTDRAMYDCFGGGVTIAGDTAVISAYCEDAYSGAVYVFTRSGTTWTQQAKLTASEPGVYDLFGVFVAIAGDTVVVGDFFDDDNGTDSGSAYVFTRSGTTWTQQAKLLASDGAANDLFGNSVAIAGDTVVIGAEQDDEYRGSAYVFTRSGTTWTQQAKLTASDRATEDYFGLSVAIAGETVIVTAPWDDDNGSLSGSAYVFDVPTNVSPTVTITGPTEGALYPISTGVLLTADIVDRDAGDTHNCIVNWGDDRSYGPVACNATASGFSAGPHTYAAAGVYTIFVSVTDAAGEVADDEIMVVAYDPSAGFVTGGGWIDSPAGAYVAEPSLTGKASFGFVAKYKNGANVPDGNTQFVFQSGELNFHSDTYEWLVVAGGKTQFKGVGTINGQVGYGFLIFATDAESTPAAGDTDAFRIKIWDKNNLDAPVYDNQIEYPLGGGSILIHVADRK